MLFYKIFLFCSALGNALCNFGRRHCYLKNISVKYFEFRPVVQGRCCFTDISIFSSGDYFVWRSGTICAFLVVVIMRNSSAKLF